MSATYISSAILAGGHSTRMGTDKALLRLHPGGQTLIETVVARLTEAGLPPALIVADTPGRYDWLGIRGEVDVIPGAGALGGILTALTYSPGPRTLVVACDMPHLNPALLRFMAAIPLEADALVPRWVDESGTLRLEPLHAIYTAPCIEPIRAKIEAGRLKATDTLADLNLQYVEESELRSYDPTLNSFRNVNTPQDWAALVSLHSE
jgi:molybdopterin-guanine dinucleotide biosynthesis protein A